MARLNGLGYNTKQSTKYYGRREVQKMQNTRSEGIIFMEHGAWSMETTADGQGSTAKMQHSTRREKGYYGRTMAEA